ncbi:Nitrate transporter 1/peptide transporter family protein [Heracleum sosnowskyi]|uniref:Nitrate transporter 1/peptide transporter family protein n=1 Tax=Heracleum sosnowskyi TaxID=360622 RepID=A0AAD8HRC0_9APIA|nr:Nitrate transporter 1/peptide transporter family protein [Heracleum sosnowskyi]
MSTASSVISPLLSNDVVDGAVDYKNRPVNRSSSGGWRSAVFIIGVEVAERFAYYGISLNLITYLTGELGQSTATAAANVNAWSGAAMLTPLLGAFIADSYLGRYRTIIVASFLYVLGLGLLTLSAVIPFSSRDCESAANSLSCPPPLFQVILFFSSLYLVALAQGGHKPCVQAFGADQFDAEDLEERKAKSSFFNWWYFGLCSGTLAALTILSYIQDNLSWGLGFGIPCIAMSMALVVYLLGTMSYRFSINSDEKSPFMRIGKVFLIAGRNRRLTSSALSFNEESRGILPDQGSQQFSFLNKALLSPDCLKEDEKVCSISEVEEAKAILRLAPIWASCLVYGIVFAQSPTLFTKQGVTMNRSIGSNFQIPPAALQSFIYLAILLFIPIYDRVLVPVARILTRKPSGITMLQRIGVGLLFSVFSMLSAALVEIKRLRTAQDYGLVDTPDVFIPMSIWWLVPQYVLLGLADVFAMVGLQEFFYDQVHSELKSLGLALYLSIFGVGSFLSSFLISVIQKVSSEKGRDCWFSDNLNRAHLDYFYWLLSGLSAMALVLYLYFARSYIYNRQHTL